MAHRTILPALVGVLLTLGALSPLPLLAQASREGPTFPIAGGWGAIRHSDVAFDPANNVYLVVSGNNTHGRFVSADGTPLGTAFYIPTSGTHDQGPRTAYSPHLGGFLVVWFDTRVNPNVPQIWGRLVKFGAGGAPSFPGGDFLVGAPAGGTNGEKVLDVAYATTSQRFLVVYNRIGGFDIEGRLVDLNGAPVGGPISITADIHYQTEPSVTYSPTSNQFLVAWGQWYEPTGPGAIQVRTVDANSGALGGIHQPNVAAACNVPQVEYNAGTNQFYLAWYQTGNIFGRILNIDGSPAGNTSVIAANYASYDGLGLAHNPVSGTYFAVFHGNAPSSLPQEDAGVQVSAGGVPDIPITVTQTGSLVGNFYPRVTAHTGIKEWMVSTGTGFTHFSGQRIKTGSSGPGGPPPPPPPPPSPSPITIDLSPAAAPNGSWFLAEGAASTDNNGFHTYYLIANEHGVPVLVRAYFSRDDGNTTKHDFWVAAGSRLTLSLRDLVGPGTFGAVFQSLSPGFDIFVSRSMYFGPNFKVSTMAEGTKLLVPSWVFAEGSRGGEFFANFYLLYNPTQTPISVTAAYYRADGQVINRSYPVGPQQRYTIFANAVPELAGTDFSVQFVESSQKPFVAERAMYWGNPWVGGTATLGAPAWSPTWFFAEGAAAHLFETFYLVFNPHPFPVGVNVYLAPEFQSPSLRSFTVPPTSRFTMYLNQEVGNIGGVAAYFAANAPILIERSIYWGASRVEGTNVIGAPVPAADWHLPEGTASGQFDNFLLLFNTNPYPIALDITVFVEGVGAFTPSAAHRTTVGPWARKTVYMNDFLRRLEQTEGLPAGLLAGKPFSTRVKVVGAGSVIVEETLYHHRDGGNYWRAGAASLGIPR
jgi:hypothetical protein